MRKTILIAVVLTAAACLCVLFVSRVRQAHGLTLHAYYRHAQNVQKGMPVCVDGVQLGSVSSVTVRPELGERPIELVLALNPPYDLEIPVGSTAQIAEPGILRPTVVDIDTRAGHGPPIADGGTIDGRDSTDDQAAHALGVVVKALVNESKAQNQEKPALTRDQKKNDHGH